ncbi:MAG: hypothetical protein R3304_10905 [Longimicrobiales bacterium]|nr:hypothetical protein [Longimicrobiales bacterium]
MSRLRRLHPVLLVAALTALPLSACGGEPFEPPPEEEPENPVPTLTEVTPAEIQRGSPEQVMVVSGTSFVEGAVVRVGPQSRPTEFKDATTLEATLIEGFLQLPGSHAVTVINPSPGGGPSNELTLDVVNPLPSLEGLSVDTATVGSDPLPVRLDGDGFFDDSEVLVDGEPRDATLLEPGALEVVLDTSDMSAPASLEIRVSNAGPGGGASEPRVLEVVNPRPGILLLPSRGATAGGPGFELAVHGEGFLESSVVRWDGQALPTTLLTSSRLQATVSSDLVATAGAVTVSVENPSPGGGADSTRLTVRTPGPATVTAQVNVGLRGRDLVADTVRGRLYVSIPSGAPDYADQIVEYDPFQPGIGRSTFIGSDPGRLAMADDGSALYVGLDGAGAIRRLDPDTFVPGLQWALPAGQYAGDMITVPGQPSTVVVSRARFGISPPMDGITVYDDGVARPDVAGNWIGGDAIAMAGRTDRVHGLDNTTTILEFSTMELDADGLRHVRTSEDLFSNFHTDIVGAAGRVYGTDGSVVDAGLHTRVGTLQRSFAVRPDPETGRVYLLDGDEIRVFDMNTFLLLGSIPLGSYGFGEEGDRIPTLVRWGDDGLAFLSSTLLVVVRSPIVAP